jgi:hypothetical protein
VLHCDKIEDYCGSLGKYTQGLDFTSVRHCDKIEDYRGSLGKVYKGILGIYIISSKYIDMSYVLTETIPIERALYIHEMTFNQFKVFCKTCDNDVERKVLFNRVKRICNEIIINNGSVLREYKYSDSMEHFGRLCSNGMQGVKKAFRGFLVNHTTDIDMDNAHPVILSYICKKNDIKCPYLDYYIQNREEVLESFPNKTRGDAKSYLLSCINCNVHNKNEKHEFYRKWDNETKRLQLALGHINEYKVIRDTVPDDRNFNIKGSEMSRLLCTFEDKILQVILKTIESENIQIATLMYDGCMVYGDHYNNPDLLEKSTAACESEFTGLNMKWSYKSHSTEIVVPDGWKSKKLEKLVQKVEMLPSSEIADEIKQSKISGVMDRDDSGAADIVLKHYPHWKCSNNTLYVFDYTTRMWSDNIDVQNRIITSLSQYLVIVKQTKEGLELTGKNYAKCNFKRQEMIPYIRQNCVDDDWLMRSQRTYLGKVLFKNRHYDFLESIFHYGFKYGEDSGTNGYNPEIVFMYRIDHDFTHFDDDEMEYMESIKERLFTTPLGKDVGEYFIQSVARGFAGDVMKRILFGLGPSNTGKLIFTKACQLSLGQYCGSFTAENLAYNNNSGDEAQKMRWVYLLRHKRLAISNEITNNKPLNSNLIKKICSGGDALQGRVHGGLETEFIPQFLTIFLANDLPPIKPYDEPMQKRAKVIGYTKAFVDEPSNEFELKKDSNLDKEMTTLKFRRCFVGLLIKSYLEFQIGGRVEIEPIEVNQAKATWLGADDENDIMGKFQESTRSQITHLTL